MNAVFSLLLLTVLVFLLQVITGRVRKMPFVFNNVLAVGALFIPLGYVLGPEQLGAVSWDGLALFGPLHRFAIGWVGLMIGLQLNLRDLATIPRRYYVVALVNTAVTSSVAALLFVASSRYAPGLSLLSAREAIGFALLVASVSPLSLFLFMRQHRIVTERAQLIRFLVTFNNVIVVVAFGALRFADAPPLHLGSELPVAATAALIIAMSGTLGLFCTYLTRARLTPDEDFALLLGIVLLTTGLAGLLHVSSLFQTLIVGAATANLSRRRHEVLSNVARYEKHLYVLLLLLTGLSLTLTAADGAYAFRWLLVSLAVLPLAHLIGGVILRPTVGTRLGGLTLVSRGGLTIALALDFTGWLDARAAATALVIAAGGLLGTSLLSPVLLSAFGFEERLARRTTP